MFSYIAGLIGVFTGGNTVKHKTEESKLEEPPLVSERENGKTNKKSFDGTVTSYFNNCGLINDHIYFTSSVVCGGEEAQVGDDVCVEASRSHSEGGWVAHKVQITSLWVTDKDNRDKKPSKDKVIGTVSACNFNTISIKVNTELTVSSHKLKLGYKPFRGDLVQIEIWRKHDDDFLDIIMEENIISIFPLREKKIHGTVTEMLSGYGFINDDVYFPFNCCEKGYRTKKGDPVVAFVIESKQKRGDWRAVNVSLKKTKRHDLNDVSPVKVDNYGAVLANNHGVTVTKGDFGDVDLNELCKSEICVSNSGKEDVIFCELQTAQNLNLKVSNDDKNHSTEHGLRNIVIRSGEQKKLPIEFIPRSLGRISFQVTFVFKNFVLSGQVSAHVVDKMHTTLKTGTSYAKPKAMFLGQKVNTRLTDGWVVPGQRPVRKKKTFLPNKLARYPIPTYLKDCIMNLEGDVELLVPELSQPLHISNYKKKLSTLLYAEEIQMELEMREFDLRQVLLRPVGEFFSLVVPGLAEGRPSLLIGDRVITKFCEKGNKSPCYEGFVHEVHAENVLLKFNGEFHNLYRNDDLDIEFYFNRTPMRRAHQAVDHALNMGEEVLFPSSVVCKEVLVNLPTGMIKPFNKLLNERQLLAVSRIVAGRGRPTPYVLFGPPGTGKSVTVVESILQIFTKIKHSRILACAPSNSAADLIAERLHESGLLQRYDMVRLNAFQRKTTTISESIEQYCTNDTDNLNIACRHRIIVATCNMSGFLYSFDLKVGHFTHIFVDEAGQATEPECMIPVGFAAGCEEAQVVLAGDPFQLGPVLRSDIAEEFGLQTSFLERLTTCKLYERNEDLFEHCYNPLVVTKLVNNYRSHKDLLHLSSSMFYNRELIPCAGKKVVDTFIGSSVLANHNTPFVFHGLRSEDLREGNSPSWFNPMEAVQVLKYVQVITKKHPDVELEDIGIITPYRKQVEKIRVLLERFQLSAIKVGSVEEFQGQERLCIIISTVRSNETLVDFDSHHNVGFLSNPKRFNVAITRAQALLVIVGNPVVLCYDPFWCAMLQYAVVTGSYTGCDLPTLDKEIIQENFRKATCLLGLNTEKVSAEGGLDHPNTSCAVMTNGNERDINDDNACANQLAKESAEMKLKNEKTVNKDEEKTVPDELASPPLVQKTSNDMPCIADCENGHTLNEFIMDEKSESSNQNKSHTQRTYSSSFERNKSSSNTSHRRANAFLSSLKQAKKCPTGENKL